VGIALGYVTRLFRRPATDLHGDSALVIPPTPSGKRRGVMLAQKGDRWTVTLVSHLGHCPPAELNSFTIAGLLFLMQFEGIKKAEPVR
jgi:hypothetical protein